MNEPKVIFLQIRRDMGDEEDSFLDCEDITWCIDSQFETDIEYCKITAAELAAIRARVGELERERDTYKKIIDDVRAGNYDNAHDITAARKFIFGELGKMPRDAAALAKEAK